jgi:hypothetical protein
MSKITSSSCLGENPQDLIHADNFLLFRKKVNSFAQRSRELCKTLAFGQINRRQFISIHQTEEDRIVSKFSCPCHSGETLRFRQACQKFRDGIPQLD